MHWFTLAVNIAAVAAVGYLVVAPGGPVGSRLAVRKETKQQRAALVDLWDELKRGPRVDAGPDSLPLIVEFSNYTCQFCREAHTRLDTLAEEMAVGVVYRHMPLGGPDSPGAFASRLAICAAEQGRFQSMHTTLFSTRDWLESPNVSALAELAGIADLEALEACIAAPSTSLRLADDMDYAIRLRVRGTPTFAGPEGLHLGVPTRQSLASLLR